LSVLFKPSTEPPPCQFLLMDFPLSDFSFAHFPSFFYLCPPSATRRFFAPAFPRSAGEAPPHSSFGPPPFLVQKTPDGQTTPPPSLGVSPVFLLAPGFLWLRTPGNQRGRCLVDVGVSTAWFYRYRFISSSPSSLLGFLFTVRFRRAPTDLPPCFFPPLKTQTFPSTPFFLYFPPHPV